MDERTRRELFSAMAVQAILASQNAASQTDRAEPTKMAQWPQLMPTRS
jgi:hypothetical protein